MEDAFRQRARGRNIQEELRRAEERFQAAVAVANAARPAASTAASGSRSSLLASVREIAFDLRHEAPDQMSDEWLAWLCEESEAVLKRLQAERAALEKVLEEAPASAARLASLGAIGQRLGDLDGEVMRLDGIVKGLKERMTAEEANRASLEEKRAALGESLRSLRRFKEWQLRLHELQLVSERAQKTEDDAKRGVEDTAVVATAVAEARTRMDDEYRLALENINSLQAEVEAMGQAMEVMAQPPPAEETRQITARLEGARDAKSKAQRQAESLASELERRMAEERQAQARLETLSGSLSSFTAAVTTLRGLAEDSSCPLCGHRHADRESLLRAIDSMAAAKAAGTEEALQALANAERAAQGVRAQLLEARGFLANVVTEEARIETELEQVNAAVRTATERASRLLAGCRLAFQPSDLHPDMIRDRISVLDRLRSELPEIERQRQAAEGHWVAADGALAAAKAARQSAETARRDADSALDFHRRIEPAVASSVDEEERVLQECSAAEQVVAGVRAKINECVANLTAAEALFEQAIADRAGLATQRRLLEAEEIRFANAVTAVGLGGVEESEWAQRRATQVDACAEAGRRVETLRLLRAELAALDAQSEYEKAVAAAQSCEEEWRSLQAQQRRLSRTHERFRELRLRLDEAERSSATTVLGQIRAPARILFRAMVGGAPYDLDFRYEYNRLVAGLTVPELPDVPEAAHLLSAAQLNVAALSLRLALSARQTWCRLRTAILDDPILEMDSLTQAGFLDGLESLFGSREEGWRDLQIIMTTWSEEFAYLAAHRLAHLNGPEEADWPAFTVYRVSLRTDGTPQLTRFEPRWGAEQSQVVA
jgi:hypothetical protein